jgi:hypothetical protein
LPRNWKAKGGGLPKTRTALTDIRVTDYISDVARERV